MIEIGDWMERVKIDYWMNRVNEMDDWTHRVIERRMTMVNDINVNDGWRVRLR